MVLTPVGNDLWGQRAVNQARREAIGCQIGAALFPDVFVRLMNGFMHWNVIEGVLSS